MAGSGGAAVDTELLPKMITIKAAVLCKLNPVFSCCSLEKLERSQNLCSVDVFLYKQNYSKEIISNLAKEVHVQSSISAFV
jgi:hypothetical protein